MMLKIFLCAIHIYSLVNCSNLLPIWKIGLFSYCWVLRVLYIFWIQVLYQLCDFQIFLPSLWCSFHFKNIFKAFYECVCVSSVAQLCPARCDAIDCSSSVHGTVQARILEWVAISSSRGSSQPLDQTLISCIAGEFCIAEPWWKDFFCPQSLLWLRIFHFDGVQVNNNVFCYLWMFWGLYLRTFPDSK